MPATVSGAVGAATPHRCGRRNTASGGISVPPLSRRISSRTLVGREEPLRALDGLLAGAVDGRPAVAVITGEAGVGKSRLAEELEQRARALEFTVLHGESVELGGEGFAYAPIASALRDLPGEGLAAPPPGVPPPRPG